MKTFIYPYRNGSKSVKALKESLGAKVIKRDGSRFTGSPRKLVINWGCSTVPHTLGVCDLINHPYDVSMCANKLHFMQSLEGEASMPPWTTDKEIVREWLDAGDTVFARTILSGHSGEGILVVVPGAPIPEAPLYTKYVKKRDEYRIHIGRDRDSNIKVLHYQRKARRRDVPDGAVNWQIRNHRNGFVFAHQDVVPPETVVREAIQAFVASNLDFGACDVGFNATNNLAVVYEINTAPGLEGTTLEKYCEFFQTFT